MSRTQFGAVWAGIAVRLPDGTMWLVELDRDVNCSIDTEVPTRSYRTSADFIETIQSGPPHYRVEAWGAGVARRVAAGTEPSPWSDPTMGLDR